MHEPPPQPVDTLTADEDRSTLDYFDSHLIEYTVERLDFMSDYIRERAGEGATVADIGCGVGNTLAYLADRAGVEEVVGIDISPRCLAETERRLGCRTHLGSILDDDFVEGMPERFDFAVMAAVLHHLIGRSRSHSLQNARRGLENAIRLLKPGGTLLVLEPVYGPRAAAATVFWIKKAAAATTGKRVEILSSWANIGPPVVSYMTTAQLVAMGRSTPGATLRDVQHEEIVPPAPLRWVLDHGETTIALQRDERPAA